MREAHGKTAEEVARELGVDPQRGLRAGEVRKRRDQVGENVLRESGGKSLLARFFGQFKDVMVLILLGAAGVSLGVSLIRGDGEFADTFIILAIVVCNAVIGTVQEWKADQAIDALKKLSSPRARVLREGRKTTVESRELVPGDVVFLSAGDLVPADLRLVKTVELRAEESALTGESVPAEKDAGACCPENAPLGERRNMVFSGTGVAAGAGMGIVTATGMDTAMGRVAGMLAGEEAPMTPLQLRLKKTGKVLGLGVVVICGVLFGLGMLQGQPPLELFLIAISLGVAAIPEGLTAVVTIVLALGVKRMAAKRAIVRHLPAVETLGSTQVICSDKTGTLTQNKMTVVAFCDDSGRQSPESPAAQQALELAALCNNADEGESGPVGDPTETAFLRGCRKSKAALEGEWPRVGEIPFSSQRKRMTTVHRGGDRVRVICKGAPDVVLTRCDRVLRGGTAKELTGAGRARILADNSGLAGEALRVLAVAVKDVDRVPGSDDEAESGLVFVGLLALEDPPRPGVELAVAQCRKAGIRPVMITGDHGETALAIARRIGIAGEGDRAVTGPELDRMDRAALSRAVEEHTVFARVSPEHKVRLVKACQEKGWVTAMTGDGVNDAPALKSADIGCAMGKNGTEVARSAADMVLTDDDFSTIVTAVGEGRQIYRNIRKTVHFLLSCNMGEILVVFAAFLLGMPAPLLPAQLLWVNLVTDSLPALALGADPPEGDLMASPPHPREEGLFAGGMGFSVVVEGFLVGALALLAYTIGRVFYDPDPLQPWIGRTMGFAVLSLSQLVHSFNMRSEGSVLKRGLFSNRWLVGAAAVGAFMVAAAVSFPPLAALLHTAVLSPAQWGIVAGLSLCPLAVVEGEKAMKGKKQ